MKSFREIHDRALARKGEEALAARMPRARSAAELAATPDDRWLAAMARRVFAAGFVWRIIEAKWPGFEAAFGGFDPVPLVMLDEPGVEALCQDARIVRNRQKVMATLHNAQFVLDVAEARGSFGAWIAEWPEDDLLGLWAALKRRGARLGGHSGPRLLREMGRSTFILTGDVVAALRDARVITKAPTSKAAMKAVLTAFDAWRAESGLDYGALSVILACSIDAGG